MHKLVWHNFSSEFTHPPEGLSDFDQRGAFFAGPGDILLVHRRLNLEYETYLRTLGFLQGVTIVSFQDYGDNFEKGTVWQGSLLTALQRMMNDTGGEWILSSYMRTQTEERFCMQLGIKSSACSSSFYNEWSSKSRFRKLLRSLHLLSPRGSFFSHLSLRALLFSLRLFFVRGASEIVIKPDGGVAGLGIFRATRFRLREDIFRAVRFFRHQKYVMLVPKNSKGFVIEEWVSDVMYSPSIQFFLSESDIKFEFSGVQILEGTRYLGCRSSQWLSVSKKELEVEGKKIATSLYGKGYRGHVGFDALVTKNGAIYWVELNPRRIASTYAFEIARRLGLHKTPFFYIAKDIKKKEWIGKEIGEIMSILGDHLYEKTKSAGLLPFDYKFLASQGVVSIVALGDSKDVVEDLLQKCESI